MPETEPGCPFCNPSHHDIILQNNLAYVRTDRFPISRGHLLAIPFWHVPSLFDTTLEERSAILEVVVGARDWIDGRHHPDGYNIGVNIGRLAGQSVMHLHFHIIPRYKGDGKGRTGGMRWVIPRIPPPEEKEEKNWFSR
ncbi:MAG TPA: HIT family protein [Methanomicrobiales archaeon]|nr:HIT family protein [Methanomicrobiales archaeon]